MPRVLLHLEGAIVLIVSIFFYARLDHSWTLFGVLFLAPDLSMLGYLLNQKVGAATYNLFHTYSLPLALLVIGLVDGANTPIASGLIWLAHIGMDRMIGYGLKYPTAFKDTHLQRV